MGTSFFHMKFPTTSRAEGAVSSANTGTFLFTGSSQLQQQQTSNHPRPPRATDDPSRHSTISAASVGGRPGLATVETTARGALHPLRAAAPVTGRCTRYGPLHLLRGGTPDQKGCTAYGSGAAHPITRTNAESARRGPGCGTRGAAGPGRASRRRAERSSQRGRLADGPPPTSAQSSPALSRSSANTPRRAVAAICDGDAGDGQPIA